MGFHSVIYLFDTRIFKIEITINILDIFRRPEFVSLKTERIGTKIVHFCIKTIRTRAKKQLAEDDVMSVSKT